MLSENSRSDVMRVLVFLTVVLVLGIESMLDMILMVVVAVVFVVFESFLDLAEGMMELVVVVMIMAGLIIRRFEEAIVVV